MNRKLSDSAKVTEITSQGSLPPGRSDSMPVLLTNLDAVFSRTREAQSPIQPGVLALAAAVLAAPAQTDQVTVSAGSRAQIYLCRLNRTHSNSLWTFCIHTNMTGESWPGQGTAETHFWASLLPWLRRKIPAPDVSALRSGGLGREEGQPPPKQLVRISALEDTVRCRWKTPLPTLNRPPWVLPNND